MKQKALFAIKEIATGRLLASPMFGDKQEAKKYRRELNKVTKEGKEILEYVVTYGPDHDKFDKEEAVIQQPKVERPAKKQREREEAIAA